MELSKQTLFSRWQRQLKGSEPITGINEVGLVLEKKTKGDLILSRGMGDDYAGNSPPGVLKSREKTCRQENPGGYKVVLLEHWAIEKTERWPLPPRDTKRRRVSYCTPFIALVVPCRRDKKERDLVPSPNGGEGEKKGGKLIPKGDN